MEMKAATVDLPLAFLSFRTPPFVIKSIQCHKNDNVFELRSCRAFSSKIFCIKNDRTNKSFQDFSVLKTDFKYDNGSIWSTMAFYLLSLHIPLSFGGLSIVAQLRHQTFLDPETQALSLLLIQTLELVGSFWLLRYSGNPCNVLRLVEPKKERNWFLASAYGLGFLLASVFVTSLLADSLFGPKDVNNPIVKDILSSGTLAASACTLVYCVVTPILEESVYRGFLLTSLASSMEWHKAIVISSFVFSASHLSLDNFFQLFAIGVALGCSYCWSGTLISPIVIHSFYNALTLLITFTS